MTSLLRNILAGVGLLCASSFSASATPNPMPLVAGDSAMVIPIAQGCGAGGWRGPHGGCRYGRVVMHTRHGYGCAPGYWRGPYGHCRNTLYHGRLPNGGWR